MPVSLALKIFYICIDKILAGLYGKHREKEWRGLIKIYFQGKSLAFISFLEETKDLVDLTAAPQASS